MGIFEEHLVEVSHAKEQDGIRILALNLEVLFDRRREGFHGRK